MDTRLGLMAERSAKQTLQSLVRRALKTVFHVQVPTRAHFLGFPVYRGLVLDSQSPISKAIHAAGAQYQSQAVG